MKDHENLNRAESMSKNPFILKTIVLEAIEVTYSRLKNARQSIRK